MHKSGVELEPKGFAVGFRIEHPQWLINEIQYGKDWGGRVVSQDVFPVAVKINLASVTNFECFEILVHYYAAVHEAAIDGYSKYRTF